MVPEVHAPSAWPECFDRLAVPMCATRLRKNAQVRSIPGGASSPIAMLGAVVLTALRPLSLYILCQQWLALPPKMLFNVWWACQCGPHMRTATGDRALALGPVQPRLQPLLGTAATIASRSVTCDFAHTAQDWVAMTQNTLGCLISKPRMLPDRLRTFAPCRTRVVGVVTARIAQCRVSDPRDRVAAPQSAAPPRLADWGGSITLWHALPPDALPGGISRRSGCGVMRRLRKRCRIGR